VTAVSKALLGATCVVLATAALSESASATFPGRNGLIAYEHSGRVFGKRADGSHRTVIERRREGLEVAAASFAANGRRIAFEIGADDLGFGIATTRGGGSGFDRLTGLGTDYVPSLSPDGRTIVFERSFALWSMGFDGSNPHEIAPDSVYTAGTGGPAYSPNGNQLAFSCELSGQAIGLCLMRPDGSGVRALVTPTGIDAAFSPEFSPNGRTVMFDLSGHRDAVCKADVASGKVQVIRRFRQGRFATEPVPSPDGRRIALSLQGGGGAPDVYVMRSDGSHLSRLTHSKFGSGGNQVDAWQPLPR
jgi:Tol biopolymer transport system component